MYEPSERYALGNLSVHSMIWPSGADTAGVPGPGSLYDQDLVSGRESLPYTEFSKP